MSEIRLIEDTETMLQTLSFLYLLLPALLFVAGWLKVEYAFIMICLLVVSLCGFLKIRPQDPSSLIRLKANRKKVLFCVLMIVIWVLISGVGGFVWQNRWDHRFRNAVFMDLVNKPWPVKEEVGLCYYLGFWIPSALVGKLFGLEAGYFFQVVWACLGTTLAVFLIFKYLGSVKIRTLLVLIFFSGLDILLFSFVEIAVNHTSLYGLLSRFRQGEHIELIYAMLGDTRVQMFFNSSSNTTLLFWLYNQIIPFWVGFMMILLQKDNRALVAVYALMFFYCPFPCVALFPVVAYKVLIRPEQFEKTKPVQSVIKAIGSACSPCNLCASSFALLLAAYYLSNLSAGETAFVQLSLPVVGFFILHLIIEYGVYLVFVYRTNRKDVTLHILLIVTFLCSFVTLGMSYDFSWRTCIPLAFYLMLLVLKYMEGMHFKSKKGICLLVILCLGAVTPLTEMLRTARGEAAVLRGEESARSDSLPSAFQVEDNACYTNFIGNPDSFFFKHLTR